MTAGTYVLLALLGFGVGAFGTLVGAGGGFVLVPLLLLVYPKDSPSTITAISLVVVFFNALSGSIAYARQRRIDYRSGLAFSAAALPGAVAGALVVTLAARRTFDILTAVLLIALAAWLLIGRRDRLHERGSDGETRVIVARDGTTYRYRARVAWGVAYSVVVGFVSSFLGIGGGIIHVPLLVRALGFPTHVATATSHFVVANLSAAGSIAHAVAGSFAGGVGIRRSIALSVGVIAGAQLGAWISSRTSGRLIQQLLAFGLLALALRLLVGVA